MSILVPTLSRARESANRTACLSNLRQLFTMFMIYADNNKDQIPLGTMSSVPSNNMIIRQGSTYPPLGCLYRSRLAGNDGKVFYCPSCQIIGYMYDDPNSQNLWTPDGGSNASVRASYGVRYLDAQGFPIFWKSAAPYTAVTRVGPAATDTDYAPYTRIGKMKNFALVSDLFASPDRVNGAHKKGINVVYANGKGIWVPREQLSRLPMVFMYRGVIADVSAQPGGGTITPWENLPRAYSTTGNTFWGDSYGPTMAAVWYMLDQQ